MKQVLLALTVFFALSVSGQKTKIVDSVKINTDSIATLKTVNELYGFMMKKNVGVKDYSLVQSIIVAYLNEKFIKPKK